MNTQDWSPFRWTGWMSLQSKGLSRVFSNTTVQKHQFLLKDNCFTEFCFFLSNLIHTYESAIGIHISRNVFSFFFFCLFKILILPPSHQAWADVLGYSQPRELKTISSVLYSPLGAMMILRRAVVESGVGLTCRPLSWRLALT